MPHAVRLGALALALVLALAACSALTSDTSDPVPPDGDPVTQPNPDDGTTRPSLSLVGDPSFDPMQLSAVQREHYDALWRELRDRDNRRAVMGLADADCVFIYGRTLHYHVQSVLAAFRVTGDLALLDYVDSIAERMRAELRDGWRDTIDGTDGTRDGYLNWVFRHHTDNPSTTGKDVNRALDEIATHALVAMVAYALDLNRDLPSPTGRDYAAHADFWLDYLVNHFEAKWRERRDVPEGFPIMIRPFTHTYYAWTKWHYYMWLLTGDDGYGDEAHRMADMLWENVRRVKTPNGTAYVWPSGVFGEDGGDKFDHLHQLGYANSVFGDAVTFHLEGFHDWASPDRMRSFARTITEFVFDTDDPLENGFAPDIGGGKARAGLPAPPDQVRRSISNFAGYQLAHLSAWDDTDTLSDVVGDIQETLGSADTTHLAAGLLLSATVTQPQPESVATEGR